MKVILYLSLFIIFNRDIFADAPYQRYLNTNERLPKEEVCSTTGFYDSNTAFTFFGDSRVDLVSNPLYGASSLDFYLGTGGQWNTQNFAVSATTSVALLAQTKICYNLISILGCTNTNEYFLSRTRTT